MNLGVCASRSLRDHPPKGGLPSPQANKKAFSFPGRLLNVLYDYTLPSRHGSTTMVMTWVMVIVAFISAQMKKDFLNEKNSRLKKFINSSDRIIAPI